MGALKHIVGGTGIAITLDFLCFGGFCTKFSSQVFSQASSHILWQLSQLKNFSPTQFIHSFF
jgi:hypothetical protein